MRAIWHIERSLARPNLRIDTFFTKLPGFIVASDGPANLPTLLQRLRRNALRTIADAKDKKQ
jgi:hypothetical protein